MTRLSWRYMYDIWGPRGKLQGVNSEYLHPTPPIMAAVSLIVIRQMYQNQSPDAARTQRRAVPSRIRSSD